MNIWSIFWRSFSEKLFAFKYLVFIYKLPPIKDGTPVFQKQVATENVAEKAKELAKKKVITVIGDSIIKNLKSREISTINSVETSFNPGITTADLLNASKQLSLKNRQEQSFADVLQNTGS